MKSRDFKVYAGYYEYDVYMDNEFLVAIDDPTEILSYVRDKRELKSVCGDFIRCEVIEKLQNEGVDFELTDKEYKSLLKQLCNLFLYHCDFENAKKLEVA